MVQHRRETVPANGQKRDPPRAPLVPVIDEERYSAQRGESGRDRRHGFVTRGRGFDDLAAAVECQAAARDHYSALDAADVLADRKGVEEFVGEEQERFGGKILDRIMPLRLGDRLLLKLAQERAGLDQMRIAAKARRAEDAQRIGG
jgi:hypothetical protein